MIFRTVLAWGLLLAHMLLTGCASSPEQRDRPEWVDGQATGWPAAQYLTGQGSGATRSQAENRARAALALTLEARIEAELSDETRFQASAGSASRDGAGAETDITRKITARTHQVIRGVEIADVWRAPDEGEYHALAVLERAPARRQLRDEIRELDARTAREVDRARASRDVLAAIAAASRAVEAQEARRDLQSVLRVIDRGGRGIPPPWPLARLAADRDALMDRIVLEARAEEEDAGELARRLSAALSRAGFRVARAGQEADYVVTVRLDLDDLGRREGWFWKKGTLTLSLRDAQGRVRGVRDWDIKQAGREPLLAQRRVMDQVSRILDDSLRDAITGFAAP